MKKLFALTALLATTNFSFAQETFTSKQEAINYLKQAFSTYFIKTAVYKTNDAENIAFIYVSLYALRSSRYSHPERSFLVKISQCGAVKVDKIRSRFESIIPDKKSG